MPAHRLIHASGNGESGRFSCLQIVQVDVFVSVDVRGEYDALAVGRKLAAANFPSIFGEPGNFL